MYNKGPSWRASVRTSNGEPPVDRPNTGEVASLQVHHQPPPPRRRLPPSPLIWDHVLAHLSNMCFAEWPN